MSDGRSIPCLAGYYCLEGSNSSMSVGYSFGDVCPPGHYCPEMTTEPQQCPPGTFSNLTQLMNLTDCTQCCTDEYGMGKRHLEHRGRRLRRNNVQKRPDTEHHLTACWQSIMIGRSMRLSMCIHMRP